MTLKPSLVFINGRFLTQPVTGVQRFAAELLKALDQAIENDPTSLQNIRFICLIPRETEDKNLPEWRNIHIQKCGRLAGNLWEQFELPFFARRGLLLSLCNIGPVLHFNQVVIFHDASVFAVPQAYSLGFKIKYRLIMWVLARTARQLLTDSQFSREELAHYLKIKKEKILVNPGGCEHILNIEPDNSILADKRIAQKSFLLAVGSSSPHKNLFVVEEAIGNFPEIPIYLVIAGGTNSNIFKMVDKVETQRIVRLGYVTDAQLRALYTQAVGFVFPSIYEGFGLPPLEAMACGCPVLCSDRASLPEICGDAAVYFDPLRPAELADQIDRFLSDPRLQETMRARGFEQCKKFTWENSARITLDKIIHLLQMEG